jgi:hypothetical protein
MFLKFDPYRVWCSIFYSKLVNCILFKIIVQHVRFVKGREKCGSGERNFKIWIDFRKSPRFSLTSPLSQLREKSIRPVFTMCGEPWYIHVYVWFKNDKYVIWMWIWLILKNISLLNRIWNLWLVRFTHSPTNFILWLSSLIFSVSINSHPDNI